MVFLCNNNLTEVAFHPNFTIEGECSSNPLSGISCVHQLDNRMFNSSSAETDSNIVFTPDLWNISGVNAPLVRHQFPINYMDTSIAAVGALKCYTQQEWFIMYPIDPCSRKNYDISDGSFGKENEYDSGYNGYLEGCNTQPEGYEGGYGQEPYFGDRKGGHGTNSDTQEL